MCGRFNIINDDSLQALLAELGINLQLPDHYNIAPTEMVPVVTERDGQREAHTMRWWLTPHWAPDVTTKFSMFNARLEGVEQSRAFKVPFRSQRGIIPASSFIEWQGEKGHKTPYLIKPVTGALAFAALWDSWDNDEQYLESCTILTREAVGGMEQIHSRMPVMLHPGQFDRWLDSGLQWKADELLGDSGSIEMEAVPLSPEVNSARHKEVKFFHPVGEPIFFGSGV